MAIAAGACHTVTVDAWAEHARDSTPRYHLRLTGTPEAEQQEEAHVEVQAQEEALPTRWRARRPVARLAEPETTPMHAPVFELRQIAREAFMRE